ncbi:MAG: rRNA maturation RNase YbeY [Pseudomonadota bacterium]
MTEEPPSTGLAGRELVINVRVEDPEWGGSLPNPEALIERAAGTALRHAGETEAVELSLVLVDDDFMKELNGRFRGQDKATNVLSFGDLEPRPESPRQVPWLLGDVVLARQTVEREAAAQAKSMNDHVIHLVVHGVLHLLGFDHESEPEARAMERLEVAVLAELGIADPYRCEAAQ